MGASWGGEPPVVVGPAAALEETTEWLAFWGHLHGENLWEDLRKVKALWVLKKLKSFCSTAGLEEEGSQMMIVEKTTSLFIGPSMA